MNAKRQSRRSASRSLTYEESGVSVTANARWVDRIRHMMRTTYGPRVFSRHNAFAGLFRLDYDEQLFRRNFKRPVLVGCTDGVGSKIMLATQLGDLSTIGVDLVAMNVNDLITCGAEPLFFLDYLAVNRIDANSMTAVMSGIVDGCRLAGCALLGGETAEMPDLYDRDAFDLAGFSVGVVELNRVIDGRRIQVGDVLIGLTSSGVHSNGYSLVRRVIQKRRAKLDSTPSGWSESLGQALIRPTRVYVKPVLQMLHAYRVKKPVTGMAHITGGGLAENIARILPPKCSAVIRKSSWTPQPLFDWIASSGVDSAEMYKVFNMGIGYVLVVRPAFARSICDKLKRGGESPVIIGEIKRGGGKVRLV